MLKVYLAGPIGGLQYDEAQDWRTEFTNETTKQAGLIPSDNRIECYSPLRGKGYLKTYGKLEGSYEEFPLSTAQGITTRDRYDCMGADLVVFNLLGAKKVSIGTMIELGWADAARVPAILIIEADGSNIHEHPMVRQTTHFVVDNLHDAAVLTKIILLKG